MLPKALGLIAVAALGAITFTVIADDGHPHLAPNGGGAPPPDTNEIDWAQVPCNDAIAYLPGDAELRGMVANAIVNGSNVVELKQFALGLEAMAGTQGLSSIERGALLRCAQCVRERATMVPTAPPAPVFTAAPTTPTGIPAPPPGVVLNPAASPAAATGLGGKGPLQMNSDGSMRMSVAGQEFNVPPPPLGIGGVPGSMLPQGS